MTTVSISCSCCGGTEGALIVKGLTSVYTAKPWDVLRCTRCGNGVTMPVISKEELGFIYASTYLYPVHLLALGEKKYRSRGMANYLRKLAPANSHPKVLEIGCMFGYLMDELRGDYRVKGIEIGKEAVSYCQHKGLDVTDTSVEAYLSSATEKFDVIVISHVLEHLLQPDEVLKQLKSRLNPGGLLFILVPNYDSVCKAIFGRYWGWWQVPVHINHFKKSALEQLAARAGFTVKAFRYKGGDSLMLLLNFINLFGIKNQNKSPGLAQRFVIRVFTKIFRYWYALGNEEIAVVLA